MAREGDDLAATREVLRSFSAALHAPLEAAIVAAMTREVEEAVERRGGAPVAWLGSAVLAGRNLSARDANMRSRGHFFGATGE